MPFDRRTALGLALAGSAVMPAFATSPTLTEPMAGANGGTDPGPRDAVRDAENPDLLRSPETDKGLVPNLRFSFADAHMDLRSGGWSREITQRELSIATEVAGVNMRLNRGGVREMHWHKQAEWSIMLYGAARITAVDDEGKNFIADVNEGDLWYFPEGIPHSIQGIGSDGCEFLLVFPDGQFSESSTFLISEVFARTPKQALSANFKLPESSFDQIPKEQLYIFQAPVPGPLATDTVPDPKGNVPRSMVFRLMEQPPIRRAGGTVRIVDAGNFPISTNVAAALVELEPGAIREIHWHQNADEWQYYIEGQGRMTVFAAQNAARTFDFRAGDVGYVPRAMSHYIENTGASPLRFLEMFKASKFVDVSLKQWMALTPPELVAAHLHIDQNAIAALPKDKDIIVN